jgi:hypothetical protein
MLIVSCTRCDGWIVVVADEHASTWIADAARDEARKPDRKVTITADVYDERAWGLSGSCRGSTPCDQAKEIK